LALILARLKEYFRFLLRVPLLVVSDRHIELQERKAEMKAIMKKRCREEKRKEEEDEVEIVQQMARDCGVQPNNIRLWYTVLQICKDKKTMTFFKKTDPDARKGFIEYYASVNN